MAHKKLRPVPNPLLILANSREQKKHDSKDSKDAAHIPTAVRDSGDTSDPSETYELNPELKQAVENATDKKSAVKRSQARSERSLSQSLDESGTEDTDSSEDIVNMSTVELASRNLASRKRKARAIQDTVEDSTPLDHSTKRTRRGQSTLRQSSIDEVDGTAAEPNSPSLDHHRGNTKHGKASIPATMVEEQTKPIVLKLTMSKAATTKPKAAFNQTSKQENTMNGNKMVQDGLFEKTLRSTAAAPTSQTTASRTALPPINKKAVLMAYVRRMDAERKNEDEGK